MNCPVCGHNYYREPPGLTIQVGDMELSAVKCACCGTIFHYDRLADKGYPETSAADSTKTKEKP